MTPTLHQTISSNHLASRIGRLSETSIARPSLSPSVPCITSPSSRPYFSPSRHMAHQSESQALFQSALQAYQKRTGVSLAQHPLAIKLQSCHTVEAITGLLQDQAQAFRHLQGSDKIMKSLKTTLSILSKLSSAASLADAFDLVRQKALVVCLTSLTIIYRHSHLPRRYKLVSQSYLTYVLFSSSGVDGLVMSV